LNPIKYQPPFPLLLELNQACRLLFTFLLEPQFSNSSQKCLSKSSHYFYYTFKLQTFQNFSLSYYKHILAPASWFNNIKIGISGKRYFKLLYIDGV